MIMLDRFHIHCSVLFCSIRRRNKTQGISQIGLAKSSPTQEQDGQCRTFYRFVRKCFDLTILEKSQTRMNSILYINCLPFQLIRISWSMWLLKGFVGPNLNNCFAFLKNNPLVASFESILSIKFFCKKVVLG